MILLYNLITQWYYDLTRDKLEKKIDLTFDSMRGADGFTKGNLAVKLTKLEGKYLRRYNTRYLPKERM